MKKTVFVFFIVLLTAFSAFTPYAYNDVESGAWYEESANELFEKGIMVGSEGGAFMPKAGISRGGCMASICKALNIDAENNTACVFSDCEDNVFLPYIIWGYENGFCVGYAGKFYPDSGLTREQLAVILKAVCEKYDIVNKYKTNLSTDDFDDFELTSSYAKDAVIWCISEGYMTGTSKSTISPRKYVARSEFAVILSNLMYVKNNGILKPDNNGINDYTVKENDRTRVVCWGDSLTCGGEIPYPRILRDLLGISVANYGVGGETAELIAMRQGALPAYVAPCIIPGDTTETKITFLNEEGDKVDLAYFGTNGLNSVIIAGIEGNVYYSEQDKSVVFKRSRSGTEKVLNKMTRVITKGMRDRNTGDISVFFVGTNNGFSIDRSEYFISLLDKMIEYSGSEKYIVIGLTTRTYTKDAFLINEELHKHFDKNFLDIRTYLIENGLKDANIEPTEQDLKDIAEGEIPSSFRNDNVHGNTVYYTLLSAQIKNKFVSLGYIK